MSFIDQATLQLKAGDGAKGCSSFCREKFRPLGGPDGGDGGKGGDIIAQASTSIQNLLDIKLKKK